MQEVHQLNSQSWWTLGRLIAVIFSALLLGFGVICLCYGARMNQDFERWKTAKPMEGAIDLSAPGQFIFPFNQTCSSSHGEIVTLRVSPGREQEKTVADLLAGLDAKLEILGKSGHKMASVNFKNCPVEQEFVGTIPIFNISPFRKGAYQATVTVIKGAPSLKGITQQIEASYQLCGLEKLPGQILLAIGLFSVGIGCVAGVPILLRVAKNRKAFNQV